MISRNQNRQLLSLLSELERKVDNATSAFPPEDIDPVAWSEERLGFQLDAWQKKVLTDDSPRLMLTCPRQSGKSTVIACLAGSLMVRQPGIRVVVLSPSQRQSSLLSAKVGDIVRDERIASESVTRLVLANGSSLASLPGDQPRTIRGETADVLVIDEASRVRNELVTAALPMTAATDGKIILLTTPNGATGSFYKFWSDRKDTSWERVFVTVDQVAHYNEKTLKMMRRRLGERMYEQEFCGRFLEAPGALFNAEMIDSLFPEPDDSNDADERLATAGMNIKFSTSTDFKPLF